MCLPIALTFGALSAWFSNLFVGLMVGVLAYATCRLGRKRQGRQSDNSSSSLDGNNARSSDHSTSWIGSGGD